MATLKTVRGRPVKVTVDQALVVAARRHPTAFAAATRVGYVPVNFHWRIGAALRQVALGNIRRLMIFVPPRYGKTELASIRFPAWYLGHYPDRRIIATSYGARQAARYSRSTRNIIEDPLYRHLFKDVVVAWDSRARDEWNLEGRHGGLVAAGVGGPITGSGAHLLLIDDPIKNRAEADSIVYREALWDWYRDTAYTRLEDNGAIVLIQTRWHEDDLAGRLLHAQDEDGDRWDVISLPALGHDMPDGTRVADIDGDPLYPEKYDREAVLNQLAVLGPRGFYSEYQQRPVPDEGTLFKRSWFTIVPEVPAGIRLTRAWDMAATEQKGRSDPDWTAGALVGVRDGVWYVCDVRRARQSPMEVERLVRQTAELDGRGVPVWMEQEPGSSGVIVIDHYRRHVLLGWPFYGERSTGSKVDRARPVSSAAEAGNVRLVAAPWNKAFLDEVETMPLGAHDDQCDAVSLAFSKLSGRVPFGKALWL